MSINPNPSFQEVVIKVLKENYVNCEGRARRYEFWMFVLFEFIVGVVVGFIVGLLIRLLGIQSLVFLIYVPDLVFLCPSFSLVVRRLHDIGKPGIYVLLAFIPLVGGIILLIFMCTDSVPETNEYGPSPKYGNVNPSSLNIDPRNMSPTP